MDSLEVGDFRDGGSGGWGLRVGFAGGLGFEDSFIGGWQV